MTRPAVGEALLTWTSCQGLMPGPAAGRPLLVADSWLVREGRVRAFDRHRERFVRACRECGGPAADRLAEFWRDVAAVLPRTGEWFPRVELTADTRELRLLLRQAPPLADEVRLWAAGQPDPRAVPRRKGPDLEILAGVRGRAAGAGAQEAVLVDADGTVLESATASVLWWEDDTLCLPPPGLPVLPGVTIALIRERARRLGIPLAPRERTVPELDGREVWLVNALHGIRPVTAWTGRPMNAGPARHAANWREWLNSIEEPLPGR